MSERIEFDPEAMDKIIRAAKARKASEPMTPDEAARALGTSVAIFYKTVRADGLPRTLAFKLTMLYLTAMLPHR